MTEIHRPFQRRNVFAYLLVTMAGVSNAAEFEESTRLKASEILSPEILKGEHHHVEDKVINDGFLNKYKLKSDFGEWEVRSTAMLEIRVKEITAIKGLKELEQSDEFQEAANEDVDELVEGFKRLGEDPEGALKDAASGVKKMFKLGGEAWRSRGNRDEDESAASSVAKSVSGFDKKKREYAGKFGVDPYSSNEILQTELDRIAAAATSGGLLVTAAKAVVPGGVGAMVSLTGMSTSLNELLISTSPVELRIINREKLLALGANADLVELFLDNTIFTSTYQTYMVGGLEKLDGVQGIDAFLKYAISTKEQDLAFYRTRVVVMYAWYHTKKEKLSEFVGVGKMVVAISESNQAVFMGAFDHLAWTDVLANGADAFAETTDNKALAGKQFWMTGTVSDKALAELKKRGWEVREKVKG